jgi:hypothetical protein
MHGWLQSSLVHLFFIRGGIYLRFVHATYSGVNLFYTLEWLIVLGALLLFPRARGPRRSAWIGRLRGLARRRHLAVLAVFCLSLFGRIALLTIEPFPEPAVHDEFSYLLGADTFAHGHLTSQPPLDPESFEAFHVLLTPTFNSMYPPASAAFYGAGQAIFGTPRAGLLLVMALACASLCWMLQAFVPAEWALLGGMLSVVHISWFSYFGNTYWGGATAMLGGCLLLGAGQRVLKGWQSQVVALTWLGVALILLLNTRPCEGGVLALAVLVYLLLRPAARGRMLSRRALPGLAVLLLGCAATGVYVQAVTHSATLPWSLERKQWAITPPFIFQPAAEARPYRFADERELYTQHEPHDYNLQQTVSGFFAVLGEKLFRQWLFFIGPALTAAFLLGLVRTVRSRRFRPMTVLQGLLCLALLPETWMQPQYVAVGIGMLYVLLINGLRTAQVLQRRRLRGGAILPATLLALLILLVGRLFVVPLQSWPPGWCANGGEMLTYAQVRHLLESKPGRQLVLVRYPEGHTWDESWINNLSDLSDQKVIWARDLGSPAANARLLCDYGGRAVWSVTPPAGRDAPSPDTTDPRRYADVSRLLQPYPVQNGNCAR